MSSTSLNNKRKLFKYLIYYDAHKFCSLLNRKGEVRRRNREKNERLAAQVREMKRRQKETEEWQKLKRSLFTPLTIGIGIGIGGGIVALYYYLYMRS